MQGSTRPGEAPGHAASPDVVRQQLASFLDRELLAGRITIVDGQYVGDTVTAVSDATRALILAMDAAESMRELVEKAQSVLTWAAGSRTAST